MSSPDTVQFALGDLVYLKVAPSEPAMVTGIMFRPTGVVYFVTWDTCRETEHCAIELTTEKGFAGATA